MIYVIFDGDIPVAATYNHQESLPAAGLRSENRNDWKSFKQVCQIARLLSLNTRKVYIGADEGEHVSPRFDIIEPPKVGDPVSKTINGDYYPDGHVTKVSKTLQVTTDTGSRYFRRKNTSAWVKTGGSWSLVRGHHRELNPSF